MNDVLKYGTVDWWRKLIEINCFFRGTGNFNDTDVCETKHENSV